MDVTQIARVDALLYDESPPHGREHVHLELTVKHLVRNARQAVDCVYRSLLGHCGEWE